MKENLLILKQLNKQLLENKKHCRFDVPRDGWVRTLRKGIGMTIKQFARRLKVDPSRVVKIETAELEGAVTLRTLKTVANELHCQFIYGFIPQSDLEDWIKKQARKIAITQVERTAHTMSLESQAVEKKWLEDQINDLTAELLRKSWKHLWND